jgi:hypothetical protein
LARKLTKLDEWPLHQTIDTFDSVATATQNWSDGYWNCVGDPDGRVNLITAIRFYQNTNVADGYACVSLDDGRQYNLRCSRRLRPRIDELDVGPLWMEIIEGLRTFRFGCRENEQGIEFDLLWEASAPAWDETPGETGYVDGRIAFQRSNYVQLGYVTGTLRVAGREFMVDRDWVGARDHSWGLGGDSGTGGRIAGFIAPPGGVRTPSHKPAFGMRQWSLVRLPSARSSTGSITAATAPWLPTRATSAIRSRRTDRARRIEAPAWSQRSSRAAFAVSSVRWWPSSATGAARTASASRW